MLGGHERAHEADLTVGHGREVVPGVVALVEDDRDRGRLHAEGLQAGDQLGQRRLEDLDVGGVARHGAGDEGDAVIRRAGQRQAHQPQVEALVLGMAPLSDRGLWIGAGDVGVEVRAVEDQSLEDDGELRHRLGDIGLLDRLQVLQADHVHGVPEPGRDPCLGGGGDDAGQHTLVVPGEEAPLGAGRHRPVDRGGLQVRPHTEPAGRSPEACVHREAEADALRQGPHRGRCPELDVIDRLGLEGGVKGCLDRLDGAEVALAHDPRLPVDPGRLHDVPVVVAVLDLLLKERHDTRRVLPTSMPQADLPRITINQSQ